MPFFHSLHVPVLGDQLPRRGNALTRWIGRTAMRLMGWRFEGTIPNVPKLVVILAPHTANRDFIIGVSAKLALGFRITFFGKDTLFRPPFGFLFRWLGGIPVIRTSAHNVVEQTIAAFHRADRMVLGLSPEGTRKRIEKWRTGFYWVARGAQVPILPVALDFSTSTIRLFPLFHPTGDEAADLRALRAHFRASMAKRPAQYVE